ncbi:tubulin-tyrosine ligase family protein (macronuclear) [Tetrahymena thermophila SB210]|uniref:Tubulin-tyrosine ligase family protein n=1 Tax=Tetrahymena thermophila (strain SB210) TaxID=312017 RepID=Q240W4_TETTS|nr:tubulin-tyrosine ligase family protein [Tetrahymena thermophila SB210]EAS02300.2 tubulin-tyrosine ligase family protein [Tetrahymena thermophila SB210]|eukprot:XP_001022545.2 tubulin-tyrosine ligase family protein [Tetrahymena thermophila SB210]
MIKGQKDSNFYSLNQRANISNQTRQTIIKSSQERNRNRNSRTESNHMRQQNSIQQIQDWKNHPIGRLYIEGMTSNLVNHQSANKVLDLNGNADNYTLNVQKIENDINSMIKSANNDYIDGQNDGKQFNDSNQINTNEQRILQQQQNVQNVQGNPMVYNKNVLQGGISYRIKKKNDNQIRAVTNSSLDQRNLNYTQNMIQQLQSSLIQDQITQRDNSLQKSSNPDIIQSQIISSPEKMPYPYRKREYSADSRNQYQQQFNEAKNFFQNQQAAQQLSNYNALNNSLNQQTYHPNLLTIGAQKINYQQNQSQLHNNGSTKSFNQSPPVHGIKNLDKSYMSASPEWQNQQQQYQQNQQGANPYQIPQNKMQNIIKEMRFPQSPINSIHNQHSRLYDYNQGYSQNLNGYTTQEDRNKILKKILAHFNVKVQQMERKQFMNIFGLEIKQIPPQDISKSHRLNANQAYYNSLNTKRQQKINNLSEMINSNLAENRQNVNLRNNKQMAAGSNKLNQTMNNGQQGLVDKRQAYRSNSSDQQLILSGIAEMNEQASSPMGKDKLFGFNENNNQQERYDQNGNLIQQSLTPGNNPNEQQNDYYEQKNSQPSSESESTKESNGQVNGLSNNNQSNLQGLNQQDRVNTPSGGGQNRKRINQSLNSRPSNQAMMMVRRLPKNNGNKNFQFSMNDNNLQREEIFFKKFNTYKDFIFKINFGSHYFVTMPQENPIYKICVGRGNNSKLIKNCIKNRWWWQVLDYDQHLECNFLWTQCKVQPFFDKQENLDPPHTEEDINKDDYISPEFQISRAKVVFQEVDGKDSPDDMNQTSRVFNKLQSSPDKRFNQKQNQNNNSSNQGNGSNTAAFKGGVNDAKQNGSSINKQANPFPQYSDHNLKIFSQQDYQMYYKYMNSQPGQRDYYIQNWDDLSFRLKNLKRTNIDKPYKILENSQKQITHNHLQFNYMLGNKKALFYNMRQYYQLMKDDVFNYLPLTYHLTRGTEDKEFRNFLKKFKEIENSNNDNDESKKSQKKMKNVWIVKPGEITNRGNGIQVCDNLNDIKRILTSKEKHNNGKDKTYIVQKYIERPFLYNRRKFDIRAYMLITCINGVLRGYWYQEGYIRTSGREFDLSDVSDVFIHLTNDAIQKDCEEYNKFEPGNKLSYFEFQRYLDIWYSDQKYNLYSQILPKMKAIATDSIRATFLKLDPQRKQNNFEVFGLDFMIDDKFKPYLIEINTNPAIETTCPICLRVIPGMIENAFRIGLDPLFPPPQNWPGQKKHLAPDSLTEHNRFEIIFDEQYDGIELKRLYKNQENCLEGMNDLDEDEEIDDEKSNKDKDEDKEIEYD